MVRYDGEQSSHNQSYNQSGRELGWCVLVEIAFEAAVPFVARSRNSESGEEFGDGARGRRPIDFA